MSYRFFIASNGELNEQSNPYMEYLSIKQAKEKNLDIDYSIFEGIDENEPNVICNVRDEEYSKVPDFFKCDDIMYEKYYVMKTNIIEVSNGYINSLNFQVLKEYIEEALKSSDEIEFWWVWEDVDFDESELSVMIVDFDDLTLDKMEVFESDRADFKKIVIKK